MGDRKISIKEIASREGVSYITALNWVKDEKIHGVFKGGRWEIMESEYQRWCREGNRKDETNKSEEKEVAAQ